jgi:hypothetical protein
MEKLAAEYEARALALRTAIGLLNGDARPGKIRRMGAVVGQAIKARAGGTNGSGPAKSVKAKREETARALAIVAERGPMTRAEWMAAIGGPVAGLSSMLARGYVVGKKGGTYKRTKKAYEIQPGKPA